MQGTSDPAPCLDGYMCPGGSPAMITCPGGYYCNQATNWQPDSCPQNYYCPRGTGDPIECDLKHICDWNTEEQVICGPGYRVQDNSRYGGLNRCVACEPGFYSSYHVEGCAECEPGFVCHYATNTAQPTLFDDHGGYVCPKGHYCPRGSAVERRCPTGSYNPFEGGEETGDCRLCAPGTFAALEGSHGCKVCGQFASSVEGSAQCTCKGQYRAYSTVDASCRCMSGYDYIVDGVSSGDVSSNEDCIPNVLARCGTLGEDFARQPDGTCVRTDECSEACYGEPGVRSQILGVCSCENARNVDDICNQNCRDNAPMLSYTTSTSIYVSWKNDTYINYNLNNAGDVIPGSICQDGCDYRTVEMSSTGGFSGTYDPPSNFDFRIIDNSMTICGNWIAGDNYKPTNPEGPEPTLPEHYKWQPNV